jgi:23S rRNA (guanosine2251-2'-O)-methyltransferase
MYLYGKHSVAERLRVNPASIEKIFLEKDFHEPLLTTRIAEARIPLERLSKKALCNIKRSDSLQGIIAKVHPFAYACFDDLLQNATDSKHSFIFLDRIFDPQNLGAIIRIVACFGGFSLVLPKHKACGITESVLRVASGGENYVSVAQVVNVRNALLAVKESGYWAYGALPEAQEPLTTVKLSFPLCLVLGCEASGVRYGLQKHLDFRVAIPMPGAGLSFNVTAACAVFCYEIIRQRTTSASDA